MPDSLPYLNGYGYISTVLDKIKQAPTPPRFTQDFLHTKLGINSSSARPMIPFLKKIGFLTQDGAPTDRYNRFRNSITAPAAAAEALKQGYSSLYASNEYAHNLSSNELEGLVIQISGFEQKNPIVKAVVGSFNALNAYADFEAPQNPVPEVENAKSLNEVNDHGGAVALSKTIDVGRKLNIAYTINLNLPETSNIEVFDAIFQSLNNNILKSDD